MMLVPEPVQNYGGFRNKLWMSGKPVSELCYDGGGAGFTRSSSPEEEPSTFHPNLGGAGFSCSVNLIDFPEFKDL